MSTELSIQAKSVQNIFQLYLDDVLTVNRRYQRKLVWSIKEKEKFIDSLSKNYPIPLILTCATKVNETTEYEILDGLQRLNAITSFIEGEFHLNGSYFDLNTFGTTSDLLKEGSLTQKHPILDRHDCIKILNYQIPFSITPFSDEEEIDETFRRINTGGRRLSKQDVRQAGAVGSIPSVINKCATYVRKDSSRTEKLKLSAMKQISISNHSHLHYGIKLNDIFWSRHNIITPENIKASRDEELIAYIISYMLSKDTAETTSLYLDKIYDKSSNESLELTRNINAIGPESFIKSFSFIFDELEKILKKCPQNFRDHIFQGTANKISSAYQVIFLALYELLIKENNKINNYKDIANTIENCYQKHLRLLDNDKKWSKNDRYALVNSVSGLIKQHVTKNSAGESALGHWVRNLENILNESRTEQKYYDFKSGLIQTTPPENSIKNSTLSKCIKTLAAMTNSTAGECYIIIGVCEDENAAIAHDTLFNSKHIEYSGFYITGVNHEGEKNYSSLDSYKRAIIDIIDKEPISDIFKREIKSNIISFQYHGKEILILKANRSSQPELYRDKFFERETSHNKEIPMTELSNFFERFKSQN